MSDIIDSEMCVGIHVVYTSVDNRSKWSFLRGDLAFKKNDVWISGRRLKNVVRVDGRLSTIAHLDFVHEHVRIYCDITSTVHRYESPDFMDSIIHRLIEVYDLHDGTTAHGRIHI